MSRSVTFWLCDLGQVTQPLWALVLSFVQWVQSCLKAAFRDVFCSKGSVRPRDASPPLCPLQVVATEQRSLGTPGSFIPEPQIS